MGGEQVGEVRPRRAALERVHDEQVRLGGREGLRRGDLRGGLLQLPQRAGQRLGVVRQVRPGLVGLVLAGPGHGHLDDGGRERRQDPGD